MVKKIIVVYFIETSLRQQKLHMLLQLLAVHERTFQTFHDIRFFRCKCIWIFRIHRREIHIEHLVLFAIHFQNAAFKINMMQKISFLQTKFRMALDDLPFRLELDDRDRLVHLLVHLALRCTVRVTAL